jgi:hypothetical protein
VAVVFLRDISASSIYLPQPVQNAVRAVSRVAQDWKAIDLARPDS